jgi:transposase-like protein/predicted DNA-binding protein YlxM (UPF0122 family)
MLSQIKHFRQRMIKYLEKHNVTETAIHFKVSRKTVHKWIKRYDGTLESLEDRSHKPHNSPNSHTEAEIKQIKRCIKKYKWKDVILAYQEMVEKYGYKRSYGGFKRLISKLRDKKAKQEKAKRKPKPYKRAEYIGQKVQIDVKFVPSYCVVNGQKYYEYIAVDECSRWAFRQMYEEHSTHSSYMFLLALIKAAPFQIREIQTDNGSEFTNALKSKTGKKTLFEKALEVFGIKYHRIRVATPRHNGKVERQNRQDEERFYRYMKMYSLEDGRKQLAVYQKKSNNYIKTCLNMQSPNQVVERYIGVM